MNTTIRRIAVSGSAAVALLGGAAAITTVTAPSASAADMQAAITRATGAPVNMPDGRVVHVRGLDAAAYKASPEHTSTVVLAAAKSDTTDPAGITTGLTTDGGQGAAIQNPVTGQQTGYNQQITTQAGGGTISLTVAMGVGLLIVVIVMVRKGHVKFVQAAACVALGVYLAPTFFGPLVQQLGGSVGSSLGNVWSGL
ncbi:hypothetical protein OG819_42705 [Streptomyces sp. NBC_01549]|uniref:hypothetical protein n=1 Tax=Streptomyces sp. NBC_01549 TaxID=2975874 RepID=UPI00225001BB|nr:hypothetical protein [Streptomyces sp. NBC_01549]MCX4596128.1 hypothetical protein [Streptomyces sp. NBC_01549]